MRVRFVVKLWVAVAEWSALSGSSRNTVTWMRMPLCFAITWSSLPSVSAAAAAWRSSEPWSWWWRWQSSKPWPAPPSRTPTTASSHPGKIKQIELPIVQEFMNAQFQVWQMVWIKLFFLQNLDAFLLVSYKYISIGANKQESTLQICPKMEIIYSFPVK